MPTEVDNAKYLTPLVIGVTGHRDLLSSEVDALEDRIYELFADIRNRFPNTPLRLMSALAEGADRLAAKAALKENVDLLAVLPMPAEMYRQDFERIESKNEFDKLCDRAEVLELPAPSKASRDISYANAGMFISAHCHILLALWDGTQTQNVGGTAQIIYFQHYDRLPGLAESVPRTSLFLTDDESDLVYHISCSRQSNSQEKPTLASLETRWFTTDPDSPNLEELPKRYVRVFERMDEFNRDAKNFLKSNDLQFDAKYNPPPVGSQNAAKQVYSHFGISDALADYFQKRVSSTLAAIYALAVLTGLAFILYSELSEMGVLIYLFLIFLLTSIGLAGIARKRQWHRKYLDYRVLAEGLRVQFYWTIAGIRGGGQTKFAYDNFLRQRDMELGWIRNVMRVAGTLGDSQAESFDQVGLQFAIESWIGSEGRPGQLSYYGMKALQRARINHFADLLTMLCLWGGILVAFLLAFFLKTIGDDAREPLIILMGVLPLIAAVAEAYTQRKADRELTKQYQFMEHVFSNARRRLDEASSDIERREVLQGLGDAALTEHAEWILIHRERQPESGGFN